MFVKELKKKLQKLGGGLYGRAERKKVTVILDGTANTMVKRIRSVRARNSDVLLYVRAEPGETKREKIGSFTLYTIYARVYATAYSIFYRCNAHVM